MKRNEHQKARPKARDAEVEALKAEMEIELVELGWTCAADGWRHPHLSGTPWPLQEAYRLQAEADDGMMDPAHRALRGDQW